MADGSFVDGAAGPITATASGEVVISLLHTTGDVVVYTDAGSITDADTTGANDIEANNVTLTASGSIGSALNDLELAYTFPGDLNPIHAGGASTSPRRAAACGSAA